MPTEIDLIITPDKLNDDEALKKAILQKKAGLAIGSFAVVKRSIDARQSQIKFQLRVAVYAPGEEKEEIFQNELANKNVSDSDRRTVIIGAGPAGLFAALKCIELDIKPIIVERGKPVRDRRRDLAAIHKMHVINPESNYCFGEGGAGTYSDGKLYTRSTKRGDVNSVLKKFVQFGASEDILIDAHPHIGTNKLPAIIEAMRDYIIASGGEIHFNTKLLDFNISGNKIQSVTCSNDIVIAGDAFILATGHSARDIYSLLHNKNILIEFKPFALGVRAEHRQSIVDAALYKCEDRPEYLPPAAYNLVEQIDGRGVYSFCMCPGGIIAPCATEKEEVVTNGWSPSKRNNPWANSGIVVPVQWEDISEYHQYGPLAGLMFQRDIERKCWETAGKTQAVPAQRMIDFASNKKSIDLPAVSYQPGVVSVSLDEVLPSFIAERLRKAFVAFGKKMKGYYTNDAVLVAPESRTSSPVRIPREVETFHHPEIVNLYPCGEGAGYAGGIVSAAIDGEKLALAISKTSNIKD